MTEDLRGRVVLIGGATGDLGRAVARVFAETEAQLALTSTSEQQLKELADELALPKERLLVSTVDATNPDGVSGMVSDVVERFGGLHVLANTIGGWGGGKSVAETAIKDWEWMLRLNLRSAFLLSRAVLPHMLEAGWGRIIHTASKTAVQPRTKEVGYAVAKMGVITLTETIAAEVKGTGVTANVILPSIIDTPPNRKMMSSADPSRWVPPRHIGETMRFLCGDAASSINGDRIPIYGAL
ncbi:MAG: SDR family NAD(P)-dependent oxidoreductase [Anaerolineae bacterium]|jgi:NAD(P)-dependent dehydrogenase (short-subunit alcohol dehydrogenase family)